MKIAPIFIALLVLAAPLSAQQAFPKADHSRWDAVLKQFVNEKHRVDYTRLKKDGAQQLNDYIASLGKVGIEPLSPNEKKALLINAYNAFTIQWVLKNYPITSIWRTNSPFAEARHSLGGREVSLDEIESQLRLMQDPRVHAALVCAARSCPPLRREPYVADRLDKQLDDNVRDWLADPSLNQFYSGQGRAEISPIFNWFRKDFDAYPGGLDGFMKKYAPRQGVDRLDNKTLEFSFRDYDWGLNDQSGPGEHYTSLQFTLDRIRNWLLSL